MESGEGRGEWEKGDVGVEGLSLRVGFAVWGEADVERSSLQSRVGRRVAVEEVGKDVARPLVGYLHDESVAELAVERVGEAVGGIRGEDERLLALPGVAQGSGDRVPGVGARRLRHRPRPDGP